MLSSIIKKPGADFVDFTDVSLESLGGHMLFGEIDSDMSKAASAFIIKGNYMFPKQEVLTIFLNTPGGSCSDAFALIDVMESSRMKISTVSVGLIASMGVLIACAGSKGHRVVTKNTEIMAHQFSTEMGGKLHELVAATEAMRQYEALFLRHFLKHTTMTERQIRDVLFSPSDRWLTPGEFKKYGLCDSVVESLPEATPLRESSPPALPPAPSAVSRRRAKR